MEDAFILMRLGKTPMQSILFTSVQHRRACRCRDRRLSLIALLLLLTTIFFGCMPSDGASDAVSHEEIIIGGCSPEYVEGELVGTAWLEDGLIISVKEADGVVSDFLVADRPGKQERLAKAPMGTWVEFIYFPDEQRPVPMVDSITIYDN